MKRLRVLGLVLIAAATSVLSACGHSSSATGGGGHVGVCGAYEAYDALPEPDPRDAAEVQRWATAFTRVLGRTQTDEPVSDRRGHEHDVPPPVAASITRLRASLKRYQAAVRAAAPHGAVAVAAAADELAVDDEFLSADATLREFHDKTCR